MLQYGGSSLNLQVDRYYNTNYIEDIGTQYSTIDYLYLLVGEAINTNSKKQPIDALCTSEA